MDSVHLHSQLATCTETKATNGKMLQMLLLSVLQAATTFDSVAPASHSPRQCYLLLLPQRWLHMSIMSWCCCCCLGQWLREAKLGCQCAKVGKIWKAVSGTQRALKAAAAATAATTTTVAVTATTVAAATTATTMAYRKNLKNGIARSCCCWKQRFAALSSRAWSAWVCARSVCKCVCVCRKPLDKNVQLQRSRGAQDMRIVATAQKWTQCGHPWFRIVILIPYQVSGYSS